MAPVGVLLMLLVADPVDVNAGVAVEARGGEMPIVVGRAPEGFVAGIVTPEASLDVAEPETKLRLTYDPRFFWQKFFSEPADGAPLVLHQATLTLSTKLASTTALALNALSTYGKPDYAALPQILGTGQAVLPDVQDVFSATGGVGLTHDLTRRWQLTFEATATHFQPIGQQVVAANALPLLTQTLVSGMPGATYRLTAIDDLSLLAYVSYATYSEQLVGAAGTGIRIFLVNPTLTWRRRLEANLDLRLAAGVAYINDFGSTSTTTPVPSVIPTASAELVSRLVAANQSTLTGGLKVGYDEYIDPVLQLAAPRLLASARLVYQPRPELTVGLQADFTAVFVPTLQEIDGLPVTQQPDETSLFVTVPVRYRVSNHLALESGLRYGDRGPSFETGDFYFHQRQLWVYVSMTFSTLKDAPPTLR